MSSARNIQASSVYSTEVEKRGYGLWVVQWWQDVDLSRYASEDERLAFAPPFGIGPNGPLELDSFETLYLTIVPPESEDIGTDPDHPDNEQVASSELEMNP